MTDYRNDAKRGLARARNELASADDARLIYATLELRMAIESLTYDRALAYKKEFPPSEYETWQPKKVMAVLLDIDPSADKDSSLAYGEEPSYGVAPAVMTSLGTEKVLNLATIKRHYDALGSHLHVPTVKQRNNGIGVDHGKLRERCNEIAEYLSQVLASPVWNTTIGLFASIDCIECGKPVRKRIPRGQTVVDAKCFECGATYKVTDAGKGKSRFEPDQVEVNCGNPDCTTSFLLWRSEIQSGSIWQCDGCAGQNVIQLGVHHLPANAPDTA